MWTGGFQDPLLQSLDSFVLKGVLLLVSLVDGPIHLVGAGAFGRQVYSSDRLEGLFGLAGLAWLAKFVFASRRGRTAPDCNS